MNDRTETRNRKVVPVLFAALVCMIIAVSAAGGDSMDPSPPDETVKLIFIHHSCGENWLADENGGLGRALGENNYFVSDTYYGWGPDAIGDRTDIPDWIEWFSGPRASVYMQALFSESDDDAAGWDYYNRPMQDPGGENEIIVFKSCFPNSNLAGNPDDPPGSYAELSVAGAKYVYNELLTSFATRPDKLFVVITAPPERDRTYAGNARAFNTWLTTEWLSDYDGSNVAVWDLHAVLSGQENHHRFHSGTIEYITNRGGNTLVYPTEDAHPSFAGNRKATSEFVSMLNIFYNRWKADSPTRATIPVHEAEVLETEDEIPEMTGDETLKPVPETHNDENGDDGITALPQTTHSPGMNTLLIDDFETDPAPGTEGWAVYTDETSVIASRADTTEASSGSGSRYVSVSPVVAWGWATTELLFTAPRDLSSASGIRYAIHAEEEGIPYSVLVYSNHTDGTRRLYAYETHTTPASANGWDIVQIPWSQLSPLQGDEPIHPDVINGVVFSFGTESDLYATIYLDDLTAYR
ncbi:MAG: hypothetical protein JXA44_13395 [Methanospirillaceae archaeon]|nr:hypothetical protein [Methanospirillaceae archaeon]